MKKICFVLIALLICNVHIADELNQSQKEKLVEQIFSDDDSLLDPAGIMTWVDMPRKASVGDEIDLRVLIKNTRESKKFVIDTLDIGDKFIDGFEILSIEPKPSEIDTSYDTTTLEYPISIAAGDQLDIVLKLKAKASGVFIGDVDVWEDNDDFLTRYAQCVVDE